MVLFPWLQTLSNGKKRTFKDRLDWIFFLNLAISQILLQSHRFKKTFLSFANMIVGLKWKHVFASYAVPFTTFILNTLITRHVFSLEDSTLRWEPAAAYLTFTLFALAPFVLAQRMSLRTATSCVLASLCLRGLQATILRFTSDAVEEFFANAMFGFTFTFLWAVKFRYIQLVEIPGMANHDKVYPLVSYRFEGDSWWNNSISQTSPPTSSL